LPLKKKEEEGCSSEKRNKVGSQKLELSQTKKNEEGKKGGEKADTEVGQGHRKKELKNRMPVLAFKSGGKHERANI